MAIKRGLVTKKLFSVIDYFLGFWILGRSYVIPSIFTQPQILYYYYMQEPLNPNYWILITK